MKLIAHRGWSEGPKENTAAAFERAAGDDRVSGVEFDVRRAADGALVVSHDPPAGAGAALPLNAALELLAPTRLELYVELKEAGLAEAVIERLVAHGLGGQAVVFAFAPVACSFPWHRTRPVRLGIIAPYPWYLARIVREHAPDVLLLGWDGRAWTRLAFRIWWSFFSLARMAQRHNKPVVAGIVRRSGDLSWLARQGLYAAVADMDLVA
jgi:hypothetical protein